MREPILILGASGQVGTSLIKTAPAGLRLLTPSRSELDCSQLDAVKKYLAVHAPQTIINAAAHTAVDKAQSEPALAATLNAELPAALAQYCQQSGAMLAHYSTDYVFNGKATQAYTELDATDPQSVYGASKLAGERAILASHCAALILRLSWVFAPEGGNFVKTMLRLGLQRDTLSVVSDQMGRPTSAREAARVTWQLLALYQSAAWRLANSGLLANPIIHCASNGEISWHGFASSILAMAKAQGLPIKAQTIEAIATAQYPTPAARPAYSVLSTKKLEALLAGHLSLEAWANALPEVIEHYKKEQAL